VSTPVTEQVQAAPVRTQTVALLGAGRMGAAIARMLADSGTRVRVWNRTPARAEALRSELISPALSAADAIAGADAVISILADGAAVRSALDGVVAALPRGAVLIEASTIDPLTMAEVSHPARNQVVSCAVSGTPAVVLAGNAAVLVSGSRDVKRRAEPFLRAFAARVVDVGPRVEDAKLVKIGINAMLAGTMELLAESAVLLEASGVPRDVFREALAGSVLNSAFTGYKLDALARRDYGATFGTRDLRKDIGLAISQGDAAGVDLPFAELLADLLDEAVDYGWGDLDFLSLVPRLQIESGVNSDLPAEEATP
jgi:3-hydroxyisobutyrate dehydrogenase-like beta-hydroxyacid dehydrogenase